MMNTPHFDNLQNELRRELDPKGFLEEEVFQMVVEAMDSRRREFGAARGKADRALFAALRELRTLQSKRSQGPRPVPPSSRRRNVFNFRDAA